MAKKSKKEQYKPGDLDENQINHIEGMYEDWFLDYASYVILERAVPLLFDGLKPVQRRILHSMKRMDDGRYNKVANIIGHTMQFHPHGDAAIGDALVNMGQKDLMIDTQGNWGDTRTGDKAAAPRYIEARPSKFALEVAFNNKTTDWQASYDGRNKEPIALPLKFPLLLAQGVEGIAVGLATKIMPHNFIELIKGSIQILKGKKTKILPDFPTGGFADFSDYNRGKKGGKLRLRAKIEAEDKKTLLIKEIPYGTTTTSLIDSILKASEKGKIKVKKVVDNTAADVEIAIELPAGVSPDVSIDALYAFTDCEVSISPNACVVIGEKPVFMSVDDILESNTHNTVQLLKRELEIRQAELNEKWHFSSLEKIFIENRIYRDIEECETWEAVIGAIDKGLKPHKKKLKREVTEEDIVRLTEIKIKRISKYDSFKADEELKDLEDQLAQVAHDLKHLTDHAIAYFESLLEKFGEGKERKTVIKTFDVIERSQVAAANVRVYMNAKDGFVGTSLRRDEFICECSDLDDIIVFLKNGGFKVVKVTDKTFIGPDIIHAAVWKKGDERRVFNAVYVDAKSGKTFVKRFPVTAITRDKEYHVTQGHSGSKVLYLTDNLNGETETISIQLSPASKARVKLFEFDFNDLAIKGRGSRGNVLTKYPVRKVTQKEMGSSSFGGVKVWFDPIVGRLNTEERGELLGEFDTKDRILVIYKNGEYMLTDFELTNRYDPEEVLLVKKLADETIVSAVHFDAKKDAHFLKRFKIETSTLGQRYNFISEEKKSKLLAATILDEPILKFNCMKGRPPKKEEEEILTSEFIDVKGWKAGGNKLAFKRLSSVAFWEGELAEGESSDVEVQDDTKEEASKEPASAKAGKKKATKKAKKDSKGDLEVGSTITFDVDDSSKKSDGEEPNGETGTLF